MIYTSKQGKHFFTSKMRRLGIFDLFTNVVRVVVSFNDTCRYDLKSIDQLDWNKLIGITTSWNRHKQSFRIGWRYNLQSKVIEIAPYIYDRHTRYLYDGVSIAIPFNTFVSISIRIKPTTYEIMIHTPSKIELASFVSKKQNMWW